MFGVELAWEAIKIYAKTISTCGYGEVNRINIYHSWSLGATVKVKSGNNARARELERLVY